MMPSKTYTVYSMPRVMAREHYDSDVFWFNE